MNLRLKTTLEIETKLIEIQSFLQLSSKASVMRLAIAYSLKMNGDPRKENDNILIYDNKNQDGSEYIRYTIFGGDEIIYKMLMEQKNNEKISDDLFFPEMTYAHISRGIKELYADYKLSNNKERFLKQICA